MAEIINGKCRVCGYDISHTQEKLNTQRGQRCFQCYLDDGSPEIAELENRINYYE